MTAARSRRWQPTLLIGLATLMSLLLFVQAVGQWLHNRGVDVLLEAIGFTDADFLAQSAQRDLEFGSYAAAEAKARQAVLKAPLHQKALRALGMTQIAQNDAQGPKTMRAAGRLGWQDVPTQAWLMLDHLQHGEIQNAVYRADALARRSGMRAELFTMLAALAGDDATLPPLMERLERAPDWRADFFRYVKDATGNQAAALDRLLRELARGPTPPLREEIAPVVRRLVELGAYEQADALATDLLAQGEVADRNIVWDGNFALNDVYGLPTYARTPFDWELGSERGMVAYVGRPEDATDGALYVETNGSRKAVLASQVVRIAAGDYRLRFTVQSDDADVMKRFRWSLMCLPRSEPLVLDTDVALKSGEPTTMELPFSVPPSGCEAQSLRLQAESYSPRQTVSAQFDNVSIAPAS